MTYKNTDLYSGNWVKGEKDAVRVVYADGREVKDEMTTIPDDIMQAAMEAYLSLMDDGRYDDHKYGAEHIARAIMAERERCAESIEEMGALRGEQKCCGHGIGSPPECCGDPLLLISTSDAASVIRNGAKP